jgi:hypothetical protein
VITSLCRGVRRGAITPSLPADDGSAIKYILPAGQFVV